MSDMMCDSFLDYFKEDLSNGDVPKICIDEELLRNDQECQDLTGRAYNINGEIFHENISDDNNLQQFSIVFENDSEEYSMEVEINHHGVIINSIILLTDHQWNTITDENHCLVCDMNIQDANIHIRSKNHVTNLNKHKPLKKFDLHITREIGDKYHCAVCNETYHVSRDKQHIESDRHLGKMLYATNRAVDVTYANLDVKTSNVSRDTDIESGFASENTDLNNYSRNEGNAQSYAAIAKLQKQTPVQFIEHFVGNKKFIIPFDTYHMILKTNNKMYCMICREFFNLPLKNEHCHTSGHLDKMKMCEIMDSDGHFVRKVTKSFYHCGTCNYLVYSFDIQLHIEKHRKPSIPNSGNNDKATKATKSTTEINYNVNNTYETRKINNTNTNNRIPIINTINVTHIKQINNINPNIDNDIIINRFNCNIRVSFASFNFIIKRQTDSVCVLCNCSEIDLRAHISDLKHKFSLENTPFQPFFGINLIRMVYQGSHCAVCNVVVNTALIHAHIISQNHVLLLHMAMNQANFHINLAMIQSANKMQTNTNLAGVKPDVAPVNRVNSDLNQVNVGNENKADINKGESSTSSVNNDLNQAEVGTKNKIDINSDESNMNHMNIDLNEPSVTNENKTDTKNIDLKQLNEDLDVNEDNKTFLNEHMYLENKSDIIKVSSASYNSLITIGDGNRYCFVCSTKITNSFRSHIQSQCHRDNMEKCKFLLEYEKDLIRQVMLTYHCCICNVIFPKSELKNHLKWSEHLQRNKYEKNKKKIKTDVINIAFKSEESGFEEEHMKVLLNVKKGTACKKITGIVACLPADKKMINISYDAYNGITTMKKKSYCNICQDFYVNLDSHLEEDTHKNNLKLPLELYYLPSCIRKISDTMLNCVTCNLNVPNVKKNIKEHLTGRRHNENYNQTIEEAFTII